MAPIGRPRNDHLTKSSAGPAAKNRSCSRTIAMSAALAPRHAAPAGVQSRRTRSQIQTNSDTANAEQACENPGATYM